MNLYREIRKRAWYALDCPPSFRALPLRWLVRKLIPAEYLDCDACRRSIREEIAAREIEYQATLEFRQPWNDSPWLKDS